MRAISIRRLTVGFIVLFTTAAVLVSLHRFWQFETFYFEFGLYDQALWNVSRRGLPLTYHPRFGFGSLFGDHLEVTYLLLAPMYWLIDRPEALLVIQAVSAGISGYLVLLLAKSWKLTDWQAFGVVVAFLLFIGLQNALISDFHPTTMSPLMILGLAYFHRQGRWTFYALTLLLALLLREDMGLLIAAMSLWLWAAALTTYQKRVSLLTAVIGILWSLIAIYLVIPAIGSLEYAYRPVVPASLRAALESFVFPANLKLKTLLVSGLTFSGLPLLSPSVWPVLILHYAERFVLNVAATRFDLGLHYNAPAAALLVLGTISGLATLKKAGMATCLMGATVGLFAFPLFFHQMLLHGPLGLAYNAEFYRHTKRQGFMNDFLLEIPTDGKLVMTQNNIAPRLTHRHPTMLLQTSYREYHPCTIAIDNRPGQNANNFFPLAPSGIETLVATLKRDVEYNHRELPEQRHIFLAKDC